jgi:hypothetical protein
MERHYRAFWGRIFLRMTLATIVAQLLLNGKDDSEEFIREQMLTDQFNRRRWTEVDISKLYRMLGIDLEGQRKTFSLGGHFWDFLRLLDPWRLIKGKASPMARALGAGFSGSDFADRPFTGVKELVTTGRTVKKSAYAPTEGGFDRLPATVVNQVINMQPIQMGQFLRYLQGEEDGLTALLHSAGAHVGTAWRPRTIAPIAALPGAEAVAAEITRLGAAGVLAMGPPAKTLTVGGISRSLSRAQYDDYVRRSSQAAATRLQTLITSPGYRAMSDARRAEKVRAIIERARQRARRPIRHELKKAS